MRLEVGMRGFYFFFIVLALVPITAIGASVDSDFCKLKFGKDASVRFEPEESNSFGVADLVTGKAMPYKKRGTPAPVSFRCIVKYDEKRELKTKINCIKGLKPEQIGKNTYCGSESFHLEELCPNGLHSSWPELEKKVCSDK